tara:strand:- start:535 stop:1392 length:858 start_codon:yes stop_codon:yes gene_type:complete
MKDSKKNKILLTGGRGFLGSQVLKKLINLNYNVDEADIISREGVINLLGEFNLNNYDCILHLGSSSKVSNSPNDLYNKNILIAEKIFTKAKLNKNIVVIYASANSIVNNRSKKNISIETQPSPKDFYSCSKFIAETLLIENIGQNRSIIVRLPAIYGNESNKEGFLDRIFNNAINNEEINISNENSKFNNASLIETCANFFVYLIDNLREVKGMNFLLGTNDKMSIYEIVNMIKKISNSNSRIVINESCDKDNNDYLVDVSNIQAINFELDSMNKIITKLGNFYK